MRSARKCSKSSRPMDTRRSLSFAVFKTCIMQSVYRLGSSVHFRKWMYACNKMVKARFTYIPSFADCPAGPASFDAELQEMQHL